MCMSNELTFLEGELRSKKGYPRGGQKDKNFNTG